MKLLNNVVKIALMIIIFLTIFTVSSMASITGKVVADNIRLRKEASTDSKIVTLISINEKVEVIETEGEWYKISYKNNTGYIKKEFIKLEEEEKKEVIEQENTIPQQNNNNEDTMPEEKVTETIMQNTKTVANTQSIYILPLINSAIISEIQPNTEIELIQSTKGWSYIMASNISGWIRTDKLIEKIEVVEQEEPIVQEQENEENKQEETPKVTEINKIGYIKKTNVNFRKGPSTKEEKIGSLSINTEIKVISEQDGWYKIQTNNKTGYVLKELVSFEKVEVTSRNTDTPRQEETQEYTTTKTDNNTKTDTSTTNVSSNLGQQIVDYAMSFKGYPYVYGGSTPSGFDCSGFTSYVYKHFGYSISRSSSAQASNGKEVAKADLQLGDLVLFKGVNSSRIGHVGIYIGNNEFIHASTEKTGVKISSLSTSGYIKRYVTARRII